jgi:hypothetical protein
MSLNYDLSHIADWQELLEGSGCVTPRTEAVIFLTLFVGMNEITEKNALEFACRVQLFETFAEPLLKGLDGPKPITLADIQRHIGLRTNANPLTRARFFNSLIWPEVQAKVKGSQK